MAYLPADTLRNRTFIGLLIAQFLAAFNDQAIHASAMFFAINQKLMTDVRAISLMPILFYAPWAIFVTLAGYYADRFSKRNVLVFWKLVEIAIMIVATLGFWLGDTHSQGIAPGIHFVRGLGPWLVLACVFLMGMHSAFFVPAKYGAMPDILQPQLLSRGNGWLESLSFLAVILGTVAGGLLTDHFHHQHQEHFIGLILLGLAIVGAAASFMIQSMPAANPNRPFPKYVYGPFVSGVKTLWRSPPLRLALIGIAFFTFIVAYMRATVYMLGESQNPRWSEAKTSIIVGTTSLGIALGAPLAGILSGRKIELGLVPIGALGMAIAAALSGVFIDTTAGLITCIILIGFFTGFYLVPLFSLQQHRAPKESKGDVIATNNFVNVIGAMLASAVFFVVVLTFKQFGAAVPIEVQKEVARGELIEIITHNGQTRGIVIEGERSLTLPPEEKKRNYVIELNPGLVAGLLSAGVPAIRDPEEPTYVLVDYYILRGVEHFLVRLEKQEPDPVYDTGHLPRYLFFGAGGMALVALGLLWRQLPDLFSRMGWVLRDLAHLIRLNHMHIVGTSQIPSVGPVILATNCRDALSIRHVIAAVDRNVQVIDHPVDESQLAKFMSEWQEGSAALLTADALNSLPKLSERLAATIIPVFYGPKAGGRSMRIAFGPPLAGQPTRDDAEAAWQQAAAQRDDELEVH
jgi:MFS family permease